MKIISKVKRWFSNKFGKKKEHFFTESDTDKYLPCLPMSSHDKAVYRSKLAGDTEAFMGGGFKSGNKKRKKT
jgi:hypothetical protein